GIVLASGTAGAQTPPEKLPKASLGAPAAVPPTASLPATGTCDPCCDRPTLSFKDIPPVRPIPRPGNFAVAPKGCGYYSLLHALQDNVRPAPPKFPYPPIALMIFPFYDADFRYLDDPKNEQHDIFDGLHRIRIGDHWLFNTGGQFQVRYMNEVNSRLS